MKAGFIGQHNGVHEARFIRAFRERGVETEFIGFEDLVHPDGTNSQASRYADLDFIFGGPLHLGHDVTSISKIAPFIAVSYAYDVLCEARIRTEAAYSVARMLDASRGLLVDCNVVSDMVRKDFCYTKPILVRAWGLECRDPSGEKPEPAITPGCESHPLGTTVVSVRNFTLLHGIMDVIHGFGVAAAIHPGLRMIMAGDGPLRPQVEAAIHDLGLSERVTLLGSIPESAMVALICKADLYVSASVVDGTSISLLQALEAGVPVILSNVGGNPEWAQRVEGAELFEVGDWKQLGCLIVEKIGVQRYDRSLVLNDSANWPGNADEIVHFCRDLAQ